ncbi:hypothetical protein [Halobacillus sp. A5]|uniref:hypothetical protein n=1 Tax=Halobacillus sp. A5 TaxID=2880263 RepID=UPI0020A622D6|nr:hypothetical protein [Halobacillus sp. A5]MCP3027977.1 hypothetical protein [Halobacillus sp. A5]
MVDLFLDFMLGPMRGIGDFYFEYQSIFNTVVVGAAVIKIFQREKKSQETAG